VWHRHEKMCAMRSSANWALVPPADISNSLFLRASATKDLPAFRTFAEPASYDKYARFVDQRVRLISAFRTAHSSTRAEESGGLGRSLRSRPKTWIPLPKDILPIIVEYSCADLKE
jgi:hypothetical protein